MTNIKRIYTFAQFEWALGRVHLYYAQQSPNIVTAEWLFS